MDLQDGIIFHKRYRLIKKLGQGAYGEVWLAHDDVMDLEVAIKVYIPLDEKGLENFKADLKTTYALDHPNLLKPYHYDDFDGRPYLIMPYCSKGAASNLPEDVDETTVWRFIRDVATGLAYLHGKTKPIIHQDIKPANILIDNDGNFRIADFGLSKEARHSFSAQSARALSAGSPAYMDPERFSANPKPIMASDIWSLGASLYDLLMRELPFCGFGGGMMNSGAVVPEITADYSDELKETVQACLAKETWERPTAQELADYANAHLKGQSVTPPWVVRLNKCKNEKTVDENEINDSRKTQPHVHFAEPQQQKHQSKSKPEPAPAPKSDNKRKPWWILGVIAIIVSAVAIPVGYSISGGEELTDSLDDSVCVDTVCVADSCVVDVAQNIVDENKKVEHSDKNSEVKVVSREYAEEKKVEEKEVKQEKQIKTTSKKSGSLTPNWSSSATAEQRRILGALIDNMVAVKGGTFTMGATSEQGSDAYDDEKPPHRVTLSGYYIGKYEVTQEEWEAVMGNNPSYFKGNRNPVERVSWNDCQEFIRRLNALTGLNFRLPTEAQWEYAARGGNMSKGYKYSGSNDIDRVAYYNKGSGGPTTVGSKQPNELGLYDMAGNVWEWCSDWYGSYSSSAQTNPTGSASGSIRVYRGGSWSYDAWFCRVSFRSNSSPGISGSSLGLRLVCP